MHLAGRLVAALSCAVPFAAAAQTQWIVDRTPVTAIGGADASPDQYLERVSGARRLPDGTVVVANGNPRELDLFDVHGELVRRIGRLGDGPGEYRGRLDLLDAGGDTILVNDQGSLRTMAFAPDGKLLRQWPAAEGGSPRGATVLFRQSLASAPVPSGIACLDKVLARLPVDPDASPRHVVPDDAGHYLVRADRAADWTVYNTDGAAIGRVALPARFELYQVTPSYVVGETLTADDVEEVEVLKVTASGSVRHAVARCPATPPSTVAMSPVRVNEFKAAIRRAMVAQEMAFGNYATYVSTADSAPGLSGGLPANSIFRVWRASRRGWSGVILDRRSTLACAFGLASETPVGWSDGVIRCSQ